MILRWGVHGRLRPPASARARAQADARAPFTRRLDQAARGRGAPADSRTTIYGVVDAGECVGVLPSRTPTPSSQVGQYRYVSAGLLLGDPDGLPAHASRKSRAGRPARLGEEAGRGGPLMKLCDFHTSRSILRETAPLYLAATYGWYRARPTRRSSSSSARSLRRGDAHGRESRDQRPDERHRRSSRRAPPRWLTARLSP
jgi:hypothetical protein